MFNSVYIPLECSRTHWYWIQNKTMTFFLCSLLHLPFVILTQFTDPVSQFSPSFLWCTSLLPLSTCLITSSCLLLFSTHLSVFFYAIMMRFFRSFYSNHQDNLPNSLLPNQRDQQDSLRCNPRDNLQHRYEYTHMTYSEKSPSSHQPLHIIPTHYPIVQSIAYSTTYTTTNKEADQSSNDATIEST